MERKGADSASHLEQILARGQKESYFVFYGRAKAVQPDAKVSNWFRLMMVQEIHRLSVEYGWLDGDAIIGGIDTIDREGSWGAFMAGLSESSGSHTDAATQGAQA